MGTIDDKDLAALRVLVIDRHASARNSLRMILSAIGIVSVHNAGTSAEVLRQIGSHSFDVVFSDYLLEDGRDGQQLLEELRTKHLISLATVYMMITGERAYHTVVSLAELAPDDYLIKPFTAEQLQARLHKALARKRYFARVFAHLDRGDFVDALAACEALLGGEEYRYDVLRFKGEILNALGRHAEAQAVYEQVLADAVVPWARMGLAVALRGRDQLAEAEEIGAALIHDFPEYLAAYDFVADLREQMGDPGEAQAVLQRASELSPNNSIRQRAVGDVAVRNDDLETAEKAYGKVLARHRGSTLKSIDDYTNLTRVMLDRGHLEPARKLTRELRRDWRGSEPGEFAALVMDSLCAAGDDDPAKAREALDKALALREQLPKEALEELSQKVVIDLAHACLAAGEEAKAEEILGQVAAEHHEDRATLAQIQGVFVKTGKVEAGETLLAKVGREIVELNNRGVLAARGGDLDASVQMLIEAAERVPNVQFLVNAAKAIVTLLERKGWNEELGERAARYLQLAQAKEARNPKIIAARAFYVQVARGYGIDAGPGRGGEGS